MKKILLSLSVFACMQSATFGQQGYSSATMGMMQSKNYTEYYKTGVFNSVEEKSNYKHNSLLGLLPDDIVPEEIMNYHKHLIAMPAKGKVINVAPELTKHPFLKDHYLMQIGIAADTVVPKNRSQIGMMYVLDISGSMNDGKLENAKKALIASLDALMPKDYFGLVIFDDQTQTVIPYGLFGSQKQSAIDKINALSPRGGTNILLGLNQGILDMGTKAGADIAETIVIITDGRTNVGVTDRESVMNEITAKTKNKIRITTMGVGMDLHYDLLHDLSDRTHGQFHYIERSEDIQKVCVDEFGSIALPIGKDVLLKIKLPEYLSMKNMYGAADFKINGNELEISLKDLNYFLTQVVVIDLEISSNYVLTTKEIKTSLSYTPYTSGGSMLLDADAMLVSKSSNEPLFNDLIKNFLIAEWAYQFRDISKNYRKYKDEKVLQTELNNMLANPMAAYEPISKDKDILRLKTVFENVSALLI